MTTRIAPPYEVGQTVRVPIPMHSSTIEVDCVLLDTRTVYQRKEWLIAPITGGNASAWVTEATITGEKKQ